MDKSRGKKLMQGSLQSQNRACNPMGFINEKIYFCIP
jgi:hypothetical protein